MVKVLLPVDGSRNSLAAVQHVVNECLSQGVKEVHLLHVRTPINQHAARFISKRDRAAYHRAEAEKVLQPARALIQKHGVPFASHVELGDKAETINRVAQRLRVDRIVMGTARKNSFTRMIQDSVTNQVLEIARVPVEVVAGGGVSNLERFGIPAGVGTAIALLYVAAE